MSKRRGLPPEIDAAVKIAHRSPTYALRLADGRVLTIRREALALKRDCTVDKMKLARGGGDVRWYAQCGRVEVNAETLGELLIRALGLSSDPNLDADSHWEQIQLLVGTALRLAEAAVPNEPQQTLYPGEKAAA